MANILLFLFAACGLIEIYSVYNGIPEIHHISKPLLMPLLLAWFISKTQKYNSGIKKFVIIACITSFMGDVFLMFLPDESLGESLWGVKRNEAFFLYVLGSFFLAHLAYILAFVLPFRKKSQRGIVVAKPLIGILLLSYGVVFIYTLFPHLGDFTIPVIAYAIVILLMVTTAINRFGRVSELSFWAVAIGAILFMLSDSMIAINKWPYPFEMASPMIMGTYILGQLGIVAGLSWQVIDGE